MKEKVMNVNTKENIIDVDAEQQYKLDMQRYGLYISRYRAAADVRDGFKPIQRRILYAMDADLHAIGHTVKSAKIAGTVVGTYNPHGDVSCYESMTSMVNWWECKVPLLDKQGSFGTFQGDQPAAMRYTEAKLNKFAIDNVIGELKECDKVVDWSPTYTGTDMEPDYLPEKIPLLLINGSFGISLGFKIYIPHHNLAEVIDATVAIIDDPDRQIVLVPDGAMACEIIDSDWQSISTKGRGNFRERGVIITEQYKGYDALIVVSLPDYVAMNTIADEIEDLVSKKKLVQIHDMFDESTGDTLRYVILLKHGADPNYVKEVIYKSTSLTKTYAVNFEALADGIMPARFSYSSYLLEWLRFRLHTKYRLYTNRIQKLNTKMHEIEPFILILESGDIDIVIDKIKRQKTINDEELIEYLIKRFKITDMQAKFIINSPLSRLSLANLNKYKSEYEEMKQRVQACQEYLIHDELILLEIRQELLNIKAEYGRPRMSKIIANDANTIPAGEFKIVITEDNKIKKLQLNDPIMNRNTATPLCVINVDNRENILIVDEKGKVFRLPVHIIPFTDRSSGGLDIRFLSKKMTSNINTIISEADLKARASSNNKSFIVAISEHGYIKKLDIEDFITAPPSGISFMKLEDGDRIKTVTVTDSSNDIVVYSNTHALRMTLDDVPYLQKNAKGLIAMSTDEPIDGIELIPHTGNTDIVVLTLHGRVNRFNQIALPISARAKRGSKVIKLGEQDRIIGIYSVNPNDKLSVLAAVSGKIDIPVLRIPVGTSVSSGTKLLSTRSDAIISGMIIKGAV